MTGRDSQQQPPGWGWRERAVCRESDPELFFPTAESGPVRDVQVAAAKAVCGRCPVQAECLTEALARIPYGIAGGLTEDERRAQRRSVRAAARSAQSRGRSEAEVAAALRETTRAGLPRRAAGRERAGIGRDLLAAGRTADEVARVCGVTRRTVERWAGPNGPHGRGGEHGGNRAPLRISTARHGLADDTALEGHRS